VAQNNEYKDKGLIQQCFERLAEYEDLEEQGLLPALHIGEDVYFRANGRNQFGEYVDFIQTQKITKIDIDLTGVLYCTASVKFILDDIGKTVFLSRKEAEQVIYKK
jgi:hypothetical protein